MINTVILTLAALSAVGSFGASQSTPPKWSPLAMELPKNIKEYKSKGRKARTDVLHLVISIPYGDPDGVKRFADSVSDPKSPDYRHFLSPSEVGSRFGLDWASIKKVSDYLTSKGMTILLISPTRISISANATVAEAETAFNTTIEDFLPNDGKNSEGPTHFSYVTPPKVPASIAPYVNSISGLENFNRPKAMIRRGGS